ncbi:MAG: hypothetical protein LUE27_09325 [Clostridia bacterium]|nr:hypothetical protein [Clostridia bacterium]
MEGTNNESARLTLAFAVCGMFAIQTDNDYSSYDAWEAIDDEIHVTLDKVRHVLYRVLIIKKTGRSMICRAPVTDNLTMIAGWLDSLSIEELEAFRNDVKVDLKLEKEIRAEEDTARKKLSALYIKTVNGEALDGMNYVDFFISKRQKRFIKMATGFNIHADMNRVDKHDLEHIMIRHGKGKTGKPRNDTTMLDYDSVEDIVDVLLHCDSANLLFHPDGSVITSWAYPDSDGKPSKLVMFSKRMKNGKVSVVVEAMSDTKKGLLRVVTAYKHQFYVKKNIWASKRRCPPL